MRNAYVFPHAWPSDLGEDSFVIRRGAEESQWASVGMIFSLGERK